MEVIHDLSKGGEENGGGDGAGEVSEEEKERVRLVLWQSEEADEEGYYRHIEVSTLCQITYPCEENI